MGQRILNTAHSLIGIIVFATTACGILFASNAYAKTVLFGAAHIGPDGPSVLYRIDPLTGQAAAIGAGIDFERVSGMDFDPSTATLYATGQRSDGSNIHVLITLNTLTGVGTEVGPTGIESFPRPGFTMADITFRPSDNTLFGWNFPSLDRRNGFFGGFSRINTRTGTATLIAYATGILGDDGNGLAFLPAGDLLLAGSNFPEGSNCTEGFGSTPDCDDVLHNVNTANAVASLRTIMIFPPAPPNVVDVRDPRINAMDIDPDTGALFASVVYGFRDTATNFLGTLDPSTGVVTLVGLSVRGLDALAFTDPSVPKVIKSMPWLQLLLGD